MGNELNRRSFLNAAVSAAGLVAMGPLLSACGGTAAQRAGVNSEAGLKAALPAYVPNPLIKPDIPSIAGGPDVMTDPGFLKYPANRVATVSGVPGKGGKYSAVTPLWGTIPPADNAFYQAMNKALGVEMQMKPADGNTYNTIVSTMTAAKKLPDWINLPSWWNPNFNTGGLVGNQLADLTPYLSGDNVKKYPNLAAIPSAAWRAGAWGDKVYGIPCVSSSGFAIAGTTFYRRDILEAKGITADQVKSADDLMNLGKELTDPKAGVWAFDDVWTYLFTAFGTPLKWRVDNGKLIYKYETEEIFEALEWHRKLATSGYVHPDALAGDPAGVTRFYAGKVLIAGGGMGAWNLADHQSGVAANPSYRRGAFNVIAADGKSTPRVDMGPATSIVSYLNANLKKEQIEELLSVANYLAAPFGSAEYTMVNFGVEGTHFTFANGVPTPTEAGKKEVQALTYPFLASPTQALSNQTAESVTKDVAAWQAANVKALAKPVFWGMNISMPQAQATSEAAQAVEDTIKDCYRGKKTVKDVRDVVATWKTSGGGDRLIQWMNDNVLQKYGTGQ